MATEVRFNEKIIFLTSTPVLVQDLSNDVEDAVASPIGLAHPTQPDSTGQTDVLKPEGKLADPNNPGVFSQISLNLHNEWQIQFAAGLGYASIRGGKLTGGLNGEVLKESVVGAGVSVLETQVDGVIVENFTAEDKAMIIKIWKMLHLDPTDGITHTPDKVTSESGVIDIDVSGDGVNTSTHKSSV